MKAIGYRRNLPIDAEDSLQDFDLPPPAPGPHDIRVKVEAVSVNPVDYKIRQNAAPTGDAPRILGWDAAGVVDAVGSAVTLFRPGDEVYYAGDIGRPGANSALHLVDERIAARKPTSLTFSEAAALPLTSITAWEMLFHRMRVPYGVKSDARPFAGHQWCRWCGIHIDSTGSTADRIDRGSNGITPRNGRMV